jgi:hypothetical protein
MNTRQSTIVIDNRLVNVVEIDWEKRNWTRIYTPDEERERAEKMLSSTNDISTDSCWFRAQI